MRAAEMIDSRKKEEEEVDLESSSLFGTCEVDLESSSLFGTREVDLESSSLFGTCEVDLESSSLFGTCEVDLESSSVDLESSSLFGTCEVDLESSSLFGTCEVDRARSEPTTRRFQTAEAVGAKIQTKAAAMDSGDVALRAGGEEVEGIWHRDASPLLKVGQSVGGCCPHRPHRPRRSAACSTCGLLRAVDAALKLRRDTEPLVQGRCCCRI
ncbi:uncharacterized protein V6R79_017900 [Siganus canaliculatus]